MGNNAGIAMGCSNSKDHKRLKDKSLKESSSLVPTIKVEECVEADYGKINKSQFRIPLTDIEIFAVVTAWKAVKKNLSENGTDLFLRMFQTRSDVKETFERFRPMSSSAELWESKALQRHAMAVMSVIDDIIINLDDENYVVDLILEQGSNHARFYGFRPQLFWAVEEPFLSIVEDSLADTLTITLRDIYAKVIHFILATLIASFENCVSHMYCSNGSNSSEHANNNVTYKGS